MNRRAPHLTAIGVVERALGPHMPVVYFGARVLALYARDDGPPLRVTLDVDVLTEPRTGKSMLTEQRLVTTGVLKPVPRRSVSYAIGDVEIDLVSNDSGSELLGAAYERAIPHRLPTGETVRAVSPGYLLLLKFAAFVSPERENALSLLESHDLEDIVTLIVEQPDLIATLESEGLLERAVADCTAAFVQAGIKSAEDVVEVWLHPDDAEQRSRVIAALARLIRA